jgi:actin-related protein 9
MFPGENPNEWEPTKIRVRTKPQAFSNGANGEAGTNVEAAQEPQFEEDPNSEEGAVWALKEGRVDNWPCFFALLQHIYNTVTPTLHTPILLIGQPSWTQQDYEHLTQFFFEKFKPPAFQIMDAAQATCYGFGVHTATVVDVGFEKCDVTPVVDYLVNDWARVVAIPDAGGERMTQRLFELLSPRGFTRDMCEALKRSNVCEVLPPNVPIPAEAVAAASNPGAAASAGAAITGPATGNVSLLRGPGLGTEVGTEPDGDIPLEHDGVVDIATIVASGKTAEFLAKKEREKAEKAAAKKTAADAAAATKQRNLPNAQRAKTIFYYEDKTAAPPAPEEEKPAVVAEEPAATTDIGDAMQVDGPAESTVEGTDAAAAPRKEEKRRERISRRKEIEVGTERFRAADDQLLSTIADAIYRAISSVSPEMDKRSELWDSLIIVGNGSKVKGEHNLRPFLNKFDSLLTPFQASRKLS